MNRPNRVVAVCALPAEARTLKGSALQVFTAGPALQSISGGHDTSSPSEANSADSIDAALRALEPAAIVSWGVAGALDDSLKAGVVVVPSAVVHRTLGTFPCNPEILGAQWRGSQALASNSRPVGTVEGRMALSQATGAVAVDMESVQLAAAARRLAIPFACVRAISDSLYDEIPLWIDRLLTPTGGVRVGVLLGNLLRSPLDLRELLRLQRGFSAARTALRARALTIEVPVGVGV